MLHINTDPNHLVFRQSGSVEDIATDIIWIIGKTYMCFRKRNPVVADVFKHAIISGLTDPRCPTWDLEQNPGEIVIAMETRRERD